MFRSVASNCAGLKEICFADDGAISREIAEELLYGKKQLRTIGICKPTCEMFRILTDGKLRCELEEVVILQLDPVLFPMLKDFFEKKGKFMKRFCVGFDFDEMKEVDSDERKLGVQHMRNCLDWFVNYGRRDLPFLEHLKLICNMRGGWFVTYMQRLVSKFCQNANVEIEVMGMPLVFPTLQDGMCEGYHRSISLLMMLRLPPNVLVNAYTDGVFRPRTIELNGNREHFLQYLHGGQEVRNCVATIVKRAESHLERLQVRFAFASGKGFRMICRCVSDVMSLAPNITTLELSREVVAYASTHEADFVKMLDTCKNLRVLHLNAPEKYLRAMCTAPRVGNGRFVRRVPQFLEMLREKCPKLECIYLEAAGRIGRMNDPRRMRGPVRTALKALEEFESESAGVDAGTVRAQLGVWLFECTRG